MFEPQEGMIPVRGIIFDKTPEERGEWCTACHLGFCFHHLTGGTEPEGKAHAERFAIFVGLWAPIFFILSNRFDRYSEKLG